MHDPYLKRSQPAVYGCMVCEQPAIDGQSVAAVTNKKKVAVHASTWAFFAQKANAALMHCPSLNVATEASLLSAQGW